MHAKNPIARVFAQLILALSGLWLVAAAVRANDSWLLSHVILPNWFILPGSLLGFHLARMTAALAGFVLLFVLGPKVGRWAGIQQWPQLWASGARVVLAMLLALLTAELVLRHWVGRKGRLEFRLGQRDPRFGWILLPSRTTPVRNRSAKVVHYRIDSWGDRASSEIATPDPVLPTLIVSGESIAFGHGLEYEESFAAILGQRLGLQVVNVAGPGYGSDQAYLRLIGVLGRLEQPVAALMTFLPVQLRRDLQDYRPRLVLRNETLQLEPAASGFWSRCRLRDLWINELPYLSDAALFRAIALNKAILESTARAVRSRGAEPLFVIPSVGRPRALDEHPEAFIVRELFQQPGLPYLLIDIDPSRLLINEWHPDATGSRELADAIERKLRPRLAR